MSLIRQGDNVSHRHQTPIQMRALCVVEYDAICTGSTFMNDRGKGPDLASAHDPGAGGGCKTWRAGRGSQLKFSLYVSSSLPLSLLSHAHRSLVWQGQKGVWGIQGKTMTSMATAALDR